MNNDDNIIEKAMFYGSEYYIVEIDTHTGEILNEWWKQQYKITRKEYMKYVKHGNYIS
jgi:hypothetical protein